MEGVFVIAEAGVNHNGDINIAKKLVDVAVDAGADAVKFQTFKTELLVTEKAAKADYQKKLTGETESQFEMIKKLEQSYDDQKLLQEYCKSQNILFLSTAFDLDSLDFLNDIDLPFLKIPSGEITNLPYLRKVASFKKPIILSTGMATMGEIENAIGVFSECRLNLNDLTVLHCSTEYPTPIENTNLNAMNAIKDAFKVKVGYSDHTEGIEIPIAAVALGAKVIEKHFTLDKNMEGPDHKASLDPNELKLMIRGIRKIEAALGDGIKRPSLNELSNKDAVRKSIVAKSKIKLGDVFNEENICIKRPGTGIDPMLWDKILGTVSGKNYEKDDLI